MEYQEVVTDGGKCVYLIRGGPLTKIGTAIDPDQRLRTLRGGSPTPLELLYTFAGSYRAERVLHTRYKHKRCHGEWFELSDQDIEDIKEDTKELAI